MIKYDEYLVEPLAQVLINLGIRRGMVVYGQDKLDEIRYSHLSGSSAGMSGCRWCS